VIVELRPASAFGNFVKMEKAHRRSMTVVLSEVKLGSKKNIRQGQRVVNPYDGVKMMERGELAARTAEKT